VTTDTDIHTADSQFLMADGFFRGVPHDPQRPDVVVLTPVTGQTNATPVLDIEVL
jgi:hypothetical protein